MTYFNIVAVLNFTLFLWNIKPLYFNQFFKILRILAANVIKLPLTLNAYYFA